jgi:integrase
VTIDHRLTRPGRLTRSGRSNCRYPADLIVAAHHWFDKAASDQGASILDFHWHDLRHTFASRLAMAGVGIGAIQLALGHKSIAMTVRYSHFAPDYMMDAVEKLVPSSVKPKRRKRTDTTTDTAALASARPQTDSVH